jgi:hypothetical protein
MNKPSYLDWSTEGLLDFFSSGIVINPYFTDAVKVLSELSEKYTLHEGRTIELTGSKELFFCASDGEPKLLKVSELVSALHETNNVTDAHFGHIREIATNLASLNLEWLEAGFTKYSKSLGNPKHLVYGLAVQAGKDNKDRPDLKMLFQPHSKAHVANYLSNNKFNFTAASKSDVGKLTHSLSALISTYDRYREYDSEYAGAYEDVQRKLEHGDPYFDYVDNYIPVDCNVPHYFSQNGYKGMDCLIKHLIDFIVQSICQDKKHVSIKYKKK